MFSQTGYVIRADKYGDMMVRFIFRGRILRKREQNNVTPMRHLFRVLQVSASEGSEGQVPLARNKC